MPKTITVSPGDCISSLADASGLPWNQIWNHADNAQLKQDRKDPNILKVGDTVVIPDVTLREESAATDNKHTFVVQNTQVTLRLRIMQNQISDRSGTSTAATTLSQAPCGNLPYELKLGMDVRKGNTDGGGKIEIQIDPTITEATLTLEPGTPRQTSIPLKLGWLEPLSQIKGVKQRLANLGYDCGDDSDDASPGLEAALRRFQSDNGLQSTGQLDDASRNKIQQLHGS